jgi:hypothetical protein
MYLSRMAPFHPGKVRTLSVIVRVLKYLRDLLSILLLSLHNLAKQIHPQRDNGLLQRRRQGVTAGWTNWIHFRSP